MYIDLTEIDTLKRGTQSTHIRTELKNQSIYLYMGLFRRIEN